MSQQLTSPRSALVAATTGSIEQHPTAAPRPGRSGGRTKMTRVAILMTAIVSVLSLTAGTAYADWWAHSSTSPTSCWTASYGTHCSNTTAYEKRGNGFCDSLAAELRQQPNFNFNGWSSTIRTLRHAPQGWAYGNYCMKFQQKSCFTPARWSRCTPR